MLKKVLLVSLFIVTGLSCAKSCQKSKVDEAAADPKISAAVVNGKSVSLDKLDTIYNSHLSQMQKAGQAAQPDTERKIRGGILRKLIEDELITQKAQSVGVSVDRIEREEALEKYKARMGGPKGFEALLKQGSMTEEQIVDNLSAELLYTKLLDKLVSKSKIPEEDITAYYESNKKLFAMPEMIHARHILLKVAATDPPEKDQSVQKKAQSILEEAKKPGARFEELAQKYSEGPSQKQNGDLGFFGRGRMVKNFEDLAFNAPLKTAVGPVKTDFGYHIVYIEEKKPAHTAEISEVRDRIIESLNRNKQARHGENILKELRKDAHIKILDSSMTDQEFADLDKKERVAEKE